MDPEESSRAPVVVCLVTLVALIAGMVLTGAGDEAPEAAARRPATELAVVAQRVERLRDLRFDRTPAVVTVSSAQARREGLEDLDRTYPEARRRADEQVLTLLGLLAPGTDLREISAAIFEGEVAGYYDPRTERMRLVEGSSGGSSVMTDLVLAHELVHALEDQKFELREDLSGGDDAELAYAALVEGTATAAMSLYAERHFTAEEALGGALSAAMSGAGQGSLPPFVEAQLVFPYAAGERFVDVLRRRAGGRWDLVDLALEARPPATTEQVLHPELYLAAEPALSVRIGPDTRRGWKRVSDGVLGQWATGQLLAMGGAETTDARGWGGDRYELWRGPGGATVLAAAWRWDDARGLERLERLLRRQAADRKAPGQARVAREGDTVRLTAGDPAALDAFEASAAG